MDDQNILTTIRSLVDEEHDLRQNEAGSMRGQENSERLRHLEESLDQCWDLLRQRRARSQYGQDPDGAAVRPVSQVEGYWPRTRGRS
ncbi:DUF2630 family protein [Arthrobacter bussei]|jgi:hypothetical protein|uniref:DUF2630 family protein n=1 Tax=Arthrobacter bussei TaxID=2594179 RepID=A0A7X1NNC3_9MICC|nr:DUF2630 family protein [Arthrobacter bussei]MPY10004.1 DUF2630 family protein [Arthrobacter bussei]